MNMLARNRGSSAKVINDFGAYSCWIARAGRSAFQQSLNNADKIGRRHALGQKHVCVLRVFRSIWQARVQNYAHVRLNSLHFRQEYGPRKIAHDVIANNQLHWVVGKEMESCRGVCCSQDFIACAGENRSMQAQLSGIIINAQDHGTVGGRLHHRPR